MPKFNQFMEGFEEPEQPQKSAGEDAQERYFKDFYKQANGNRDEFIDHHIRRFGVPTGSTKKKEMEFYGKKFDEMKAQEEAQPKPAPKPQGDMIAGLTKPEREKHYQAIFDKYDKDEKFWNHPKERKFDKDTLLADVYRGEPMAEELAKKRAAYYAEDDNDFSKDDKKMADEFYEYVTSRGWEDERAGREPISNDKKKVWELWQDNLKHLNSEDIELSNEKAGNFYNEFAKHLTPEQENEFGTIFATYKDPQEVEDYIAKVIGSKPEEPKPQSRSFYDVEVGDMWVLPNDMKLKVKERQGRNVLVDYGRGREEWYDIDDFVNIRGFDQSFKYPHELEEE